MFVTNFKKIQNRCQIIIEYLPLKKARAYLFDYEYYGVCVNTININCMTSQIQESQQPQQATHTNKKKIRNSKHSYQNTTLNIPLITKRMNFVQKYIKQFANRTDQDYNLTDRQSVNRSISPHYESVIVKEFQQPNSPSQQSPKNSCIKYTTIRNKSSEQRIESLGKAEVQYLRLKQKAHLPKLLPNIAKTKPNEDINTISHEQVEKEIKKSIITKGGKRYFADLYLMKQGRDKIISSLSTVGKHTLSSTSPRESYEEIIKNSITYEEQIAAKKHEFVKKKILEDRHVKREKMLRGKSMNWNVYYDMLALPPHQRKKLKALSKFEAQYGI